MISKMDMKCPFLVWSVLLCLMKKDRVSLSNQVRSVRVGWIFELNLDVMVSSEHPRKPNMAKVNMASRVWDMWVE